MASKCTFGITHAWVGISLSTWPPTVTRSIMAPGGSQRQNLGFWVDWRYQNREEKICRAWARVSSATWVATVTIMAPGGWKNIFLATTKHEDIPRATIAQQRSFTTATTHRIPLDTYPEARIWECHCVRDCLLSYRPWLFVEVDDRRDSR